MKGKQDIIKFRNFSVADMTSTTYDREAAIRGILAIADVSTISPEKQPCSICLNPMENPVQKPSNDSPEHSPATTSCGHSFGQCCITEWLRADETCPYCRAGIARIPSIFPPPGFSLLGAFSGTIVLPPRRRLISPNRRM